MRAGKTEIAWVIGGRVVAAIGALVSIKLITQYLSVAEMGVFGLALAIANGTAKAGFNPLSQPMLRFAGSAHIEKDFPPLFASYFRAYLSILGLLAIGIAIAAILEVMSVSTLILAAMIGCGIGLHTGNASMMGSMRWRRATAVSHIWIAWGRGLVAVVLMTLLGADANIALLGYFAATLLSNSVELRTIMKGTGTTLRSAFAARGDRAEWKSFVAYAAPFFLMFGTDAAVQEIDKAIVAAWFTKVELGAYVAMQLLARMPVFFVVGLVEQLVYPIFFQGSRKVNQSELTTGSFRVIGKLYVLVLFALVLLCAGVYIMREPLVHLLTTVDYMPYAVLLPLLMLAGVVAQSSRILQAPALRAIGSRVFIPAKIVQLVVLVVTMIAAIPFFGLYGVAIAANIASLALVAAIIATNLYYLRRGTPRKAPEDE